MSSERKIQSARANGAKSRGPKTPEGRARSARNAITHGLSSETIVLENESTERFESLRQAYIDQFAPANQVEADLVDQIVAARWRLERAWGMETAFLDLEILKQRPQIEREFEEIAEPTRTALAFKALCEDSSALTNLNRYEIRCQRTINRTLETLRRLREKETVQNEPNPKNEQITEPPPPSSSTPAPTLSEPVISEHQTVQPCAQSTPRSPYPLPEEISDTPSGCHPAPPRSEASSNSALPLRL